MKSMPFKIEYDKINQKHSYMF